MDNSYAQHRPDGDAERKLARLLVVPPGCEGISAGGAPGTLLVEDSGQPVEGCLPLAGAPRQAPYGTVRRMVGDRVEMVFPVLGVTR
ncbi:hypothetical protein OHA74_55195 [Streptomyces phaeochromogenes]|uniref:hypothetical protein n=1 Tax=Streptomyces phaeochromogenes TaxID=1923 RepID=UPI002E2D3E0E|nr:hypothetical protein [Streptomyces phaeochromogenes]